MGKRRSHAELAAHYAELAAKHLKLASSTRPAANKEREARRAAQGGGPLKRGRPSFDTPNSAAAQIITEWEGGLSYRQIADNRGCSFQNIQQVIQKWIARGHCDPAKHNDVVAAQRAEARATRIAEKKARLSTPEQRAKAYKRGLEKRLADPIGRKNQRAGVLRSWAEPEKRAARLEWRNDPKRKADWYKAMMDGKKKAREARDAR